MKNWKRTISITIYISSFIHDEVDDVLSDLHA